MNRAAYQLPNLPAALDIHCADATRDQLAALDEELQTIGSELSEEPEPILLPENGFLIRPLTENQLQTVTELYDPVYSRLFTDMQDEVRYLPIAESGERMIGLQQLCGQAGVEMNFSSQPISQYGGEHAGNPRVYHVREAVAYAHIRAAQALGSVGITMCIEDAFRPLGVQEGLFQFGIDMFRKMYPHKSTEEIIAGARSKVAVTPHFAGHKSGAATDISLLNTATRMPLALGHKYLDMNACVILDFPYLTFEQFRTRQLFAQTMKMAGMHVYPGEDWHTSLGDVGAAMASGDPAGYPVKYGPLKGFDAVTGEIDPYDPSEYYKQFSLHQNS